MVKFFDINTGKPASPEKDGKQKADRELHAEETEHPKKSAEIKQETPEPDEKDVSREPIHVEHVVPGPTAEEGSGKSEETPTLEQESDKDDDPPKAPDIPRATPAMAPKEKEREHASAATSTNLMPRAASKKQKWVTAILSTVLIVLLALLVSQAIIFFTQTKKQEAITPKTEETPKVETKTTADSTKTETKDTTADTATTSTNTTTNSTTTTSTALTKEKATLRLLNGSGVTGAAAKASTTLKDAGYTVSSVANAKSYTYATTLILYKNSDGKALAEDVAKALSGYTTEVKEDADTVGSTSDILVIIGKK